MWRLLRPFHKALPLLPSPFKPPTKTLTSFPNPHPDLLRALRSELGYELRSRPPAQPPMAFDSFAVEDRPGEQWIRMRKRHGGKEDVVVDVTMFDAFLTGGGRRDGADEYGKLHVSLVVDVSKGGGADGVLQFVCSAWPDELVIRKVSLAAAGGDSGLTFVGRRFKELDEELKRALIWFLAERGIDDDFAVFLHYYMNNKDRSELVRWMRNVETYIES